MNEPKLTAWQQIGRAVAIVLLVLCIAHYSA